MGCSVIMDSSNKRTYDRPNDTQSTSDKLYHLVTVDGETGFHMVEVENES